MRHEDKLAFGIPDVSYGLNRVNGWIEMKALRKWPKDPNLIIKFDKFKSTQKRFLRRRGKAGGNCYMMLLVESKEILLFNWDVVDLVGDVTRECLYGISCYHSIGDIDNDQLLSILGTARRRVR